GRWRSERRSFAIQRRSRIKFRPLRGSRASSTHSLRSATTAASQLWFPFNGTVCRMVQFRLFTVLAGGLICLMQLVLTGCGSSEAAARKKQAADMIAWLQAQKQNLEYVYEGAPA